MQNFPGMETPKVEFSKLEFPKMGFSNVEFPKIEIPKIDISKLRELLEDATLSLEDLPKIFEKIGESPEKLRTILNLWFVPQFTPSFVKDPDHAVTGLHDFEFLSTWDAPRTRNPYRMFDIATGNLVEAEAIDVQGQYCILSHRWKGDEVSLARINETKKGNVNRAKEGRGTIKNDIQLVLDSCSHDILEKEKDIIKLASDIQQEEKNTIKVACDIKDELGLKEYLEMRLDIKKFQRELKKAKKENSEEISKLKFAEMEQSIFSGLIGQMNKAVDERVGNMNLTVQKSTDAVASTKLTQSLKKVEEVVENAKAAVDSANKRFTEAEEEGNKRKIKEPSEFFNKNHLLREAIDAMISCLQRWKSANKLDRSIAQARDIFKNRLFQKHEKQYIWIDACINKQDGGELSESLSLMGDWYANAEFCLVQLDTEYVESETLHDWELFQTRGPDGRCPLDPKKANIQGFEQIKPLKQDNPNSDKKRLEWSTRAWTLQELVMSRITYYTNSQWTPLTRPVESLGYYYYLVPFIELYGCRDTTNIYSASYNEPLDEVTNSIYSTKLLRQLRVWVSETFKDTVPRVWGKEFLVKYKRLEEYVEKAHTRPAREGETCDTGKKALEEAGQIKKALQLIIMLESLGVQIPNDMNKETVTSSMARAVYLAAAGLTKNQDSGNNSSGRELIQRLNHYLPSKPAGEVQDEKEKVQHVINFLLHCLVAETKELILSDRKYIAEFGEVGPLKTWQEGKERSGFSAQDAMSVACKREATVATDSVYALMGILGVRFPTFPAEGYSKALSRLLDEILITHNDVSVFNWTGMEMGTPIRGRSMYPSSHKAFSRKEDRVQGYNVLLSEVVQQKVEDVMKTYHGVIAILRDIITLAKDKNQKNLPLTWIEKLVKLINTAEFDNLETEVTSIGRIVKYAQTSYVSPPPGKVKGAPEKAVTKKTTEKEVITEDLATGKVTTEKVTTEVNTETVTTTTVTTENVVNATPTPTSETSPTSRFRLRTSLSGMSKSAETSDSDSSSKKESTFSRFSKSIKPSFGKRNSGSVAKAVEKEKAVEAEKSVEAKKIVEAEKVVETKPVGQAAANTPNGEPTSPAKSSPKEIDDAVLRYIEAVTLQAKNGKKSSTGLLSNLLPSEVTNVVYNPPDFETMKKAVQIREGDSMISPHPIIVNNSGIESIFDIQRIIVTMIDPETLRNKIARAISPHEKISGWCSISTGFARVVTSFSCEKHILEKELDVVKTVEKKVLRGEKREKKFSQTLGIIVKNNESKVAGESKDAEQLEGKETKQAESNDTGKSESKEAENENKNDTEQTKEERLVKNMIDFIQEPQLRLVAGEWVLVRFSGVPGAKWFLCHLELGSTHQFYGHRIATGEINFHESTREPGLVNVWETYMDRKKKKMCSIIEWYLKSKGYADKGEEKLRLVGLGSESLTFLTTDKGEEKQKQSLAFINLDSKSPTSPTTDKERPAFNLGSVSPPRIATDKTEEKSEGNDDENSDEEGFVDKMFGEGKHIIVTLGEYTVLAAAEKLWAMKADHVDRNLSASVLKKTPMKLQTAVQNMNDSWNLLPTMFHPSIRVHMF